jgi:hypothetical protein
MPECSQAVPSRRNGDSRINMPSWVPRKHTPRLYPGHKQDQPVPLLSRGLGPRPSSDSKPPNTAGLASVWCLDLLNLIYITTLKSRSEKSRNPWQERNKSSCSHKQVYARDNRSVTWPRSTQRMVLNWHRWNKCNQSPALLPNQVQVHPTCFARSLIIHIYLYSMR